MASVTVGGIPAKKASILQEPRSFMLFADPKVGKSTLAASISHVKGYERVLCIDIDGGAQAFARWSPNVDVVQIPYQDHAAFIRVFNAVTGKLADQYDAVIVDTFTTLQKWMLRGIAGVNALGKQNKASWDNWGEVADVMIDIAWQMHHAPWCGLMLFHSKTVEEALTGRIRKLPLLQGSAKDSIGAVADVNVFMRAHTYETGEFTNDGDAIKATMRVARFGLSEETPTGNRVSLPEGLTDAAGALTMSEMFTYIRGERDLGDAPVVPEHPEISKPDQEAPAE